MSLREQIARLEHEHWTLWVGDMLQKTEPLAECAQYVMGDPAVRSLVAGQALYGDWDVHDALQTCERWQRITAVPYDGLQGIDKEPCLDYANKVLELVVDRGHYLNLARMIVRAWDRGVYDDRTLYTMMDFGLVNGPSEDWPDLLIEGWAVAKVPGSEGSWPSEKHIEEMVECCKKYVQEVS